MLLFWRRLASKLLTTLSVPLFDIPVGFCRECLFWQVWWKGLACLQVLQVPVLHSKLYKRNMILGTEQYLDRLPSHEAFEG